MIYWKCRCGRDKVSSEEEKLVQVGCVCGDPMTAYSDVKLRNKLGTYLGRFKD